MAVIAISSLFFGMSMSFYTVCDPYLVRETYGSEKYDKVYSYYSMFGSLASSIYFTGVGYSYDIFRSYKPSFAFLIGAYLLAALLLYLRLFAWHKIEVLAGGKENRYALK